MEEQKKIFTNGLMFKLPHPKAPSFVKGSLSIKAEDFKKFVDQYSKDGWVNIDLKVAQNGKSYAELNTWQPKANAESDAKVDMKEEDPTAGIPF